MKTHKFVIKVSSNMKQAVEFDRENGNTLLWGTVCQAMKNIRPEFYPWEK